MKAKSISPAILLAVVISAFAIRSFACGPFFPNTLLDAGDQAVLQPPIADFQRELERMKLPLAQSRAVPPAAGQNFYEQSTEVEMNDLAAALKREKISSEQATVIMQAHLAERMKLNAFLTAQDAWRHFYRGEYYDTNGYHRLPNTNPPPVFPAVAITPGLPREFALYFQGAIAWQNSRDWTPSVYWNQLLELPAAERHFKSTWAAFMLGKCYEEQTSESWNYYNEALKYFEQVRAMAKDGFADSAGLATASVGEEARICLKRNDYKRAIELYLEQLAAGDETALNSLRFAAARALAETNSTPAQLEILARNSQARRVITAYLISRNPYSDPREAQTDPDARQFFDRTTTWLEAVEAAGVTDVESASEFALAAYQASQMEIAQRWINRAGSDPVAQWLQAKLLMRAGKIDEAAKLLAKVSRKFPQELPGTNEAAGFAQSLHIGVNHYFDEDIAIGRQSLGELGVLHLARREYTEALDALLRSGYWMDAAYVAERVLTTEELKSYIDRNWPPVLPAKQDRETRDLPDGDWAMTNPREQIRYLLARRLAREAGSPNALLYYPANLSAAFTTYLNELHQGRNEQLSAGIRARNLFAAAVMTRTNGLELFGSELEPDWAIHGGDYAFGITWQDRATNLDQAKINLASSNEIERASSRQADPDRRFHYRWRAAALAWEAAHLMPDNSDDTARVLCTGGAWLKNNDPLEADKFYKALVLRCRGTDLGREADQLRWFPAQPIDGSKPRLETIAMTPEMTRSPYAYSKQICSLEYPFPGGKYVVHEAEDVYVIAHALQRLGFSISAQDIVAANPGLKFGPILVGRLIEIPGQATERLVQLPTNYTVQTGDTLAKIARKFTVPVQLLIETNGISSTRIKIGQVLKIPSSQSMTNSP